MSGYAPAACVGVFPLIPELADPLARDITSAMGAGFARGPAKRVLDSRIGRYPGRPPAIRSAGVDLLRRSYRHGFVLVLATVSNLAFVGITNGEESPVEVATRFVEALATHDYEEVVKCVHEPWMYSELESLCADLPGISYQDREDCARSLGALSLRDFIETPKDRFFSKWAQRKWPQLFPPEPPPPPPSDPPPPKPWCGTAEMANKRLAESWSNLIVRTLEETIKPPREAFVVLDVRLRHSFRELNLAFTMHKDLSGEWRITGVKSELVSD